MTFAPQMGDAPSRSRPGPEQPSPYVIGRSVRFNRADSPDLTRNFVSAGNRRLMTFAGWFRNTLSTPSAYMAIWGRDSQNLIGYSSGGYQFQVWAGNVLVRETRNQFRDTTAWTHYMVVVDTANAVADDRCQIYINGERVLSANLSTNATITINTDFGTWNSTGNHALGSSLGLFGGSNAFAHGYYADMFFLDGVAGNPANFGFFDSMGIWQPKRYDGPSGGINSYYLNFRDNSGATATAIGKDQWGSNDFTPTNLVVTAGAGNDSSLDTPTNTLPLLNFTDKSTAQNQPTNGSLDLTGAATWGAMRATQALPNRGLWYWEQTTSNTGSGSTGFSMGVMRTGLATTVTAVNDPGLWVLGTQGLSSAAAAYANGSTVFTGGVVYGAGETLRALYNGSTGELWLGRGGGWYLPNGTLSANPTTATMTVPSGIEVSPVTVSYSLTQNLNYGQRAFAYALPDGAKPLSIQAVRRDPLVRPSRTFRAVAYTGNATARNLTTSEGSRGVPSLVWTKSRSAIRSHYLFDTRRGALNSLISNLSSAQAATANSLTDFITDGFGLGTSAEVNTNTETYVSWNWSAEARAGMDIVTYVGDGTSNRLIPHSLGGTPEFAIVKRVDSAVDWYVWHRELTSAAHYLRLNFNDFQVNTTPVFGTGAWTPAAFMVNNILNTGSGTYVTYLFRGLPGSSRFGVYTGNANADGTFVYTGFEPAMVLLKRIDAAANWVIHDIARSPANPNNTLINPNSNAAETTFVGMDIVSNGFKIRTTDAGYNAAGTYIYAAFGVRPMGARGR